jgi:hypothetical protein
MKKHSMFLPLFCRGYFLYAFQLLWRLGRSQFKKKNTSSEQDQSESETSKALSLIGLDHDMILP